MDERKGMNHYALSHCTQTLTQWLQCFEPFGRHMLF
jgi:hypothetical protein